MATPHMPSPTHNTLRIIGGRWRGRKLSFADAPGLRPTPDRVRETLFNWLQQNIAGARCMDLFSGSGALGLEALSRGAEFCLFLDSNHQAISQIQSNLSLLDPQADTESPLPQGQPRHKAHPTNTLEYLAHNRFAEQYDLIFVDPPFAEDCIKTCCQLLETHRWLTNNATIYLESPTIIENHQLPNNWQRYRHKRAGNVHYHLALRATP